MSDTVSDDVLAFKRAAAEHAVTFLESGMVVGLGTGSTAVWAVRRVAVLLTDGTLADILAVPTSRETEDEARRLGIPLATLDDRPVIDLTIDGADEVSPSLDLIKGGGGALLHEKIVAQASRREIIVVDDTKLSPALGTRFAVPVEVVPFGAGPAAEFLRSLGAVPALRIGANRQPFVTDEGNHILDCRFGVIADPRSLADELASRAAVVEHGLFLGLATDLVVAGPDGVEHLRAPDRRSDPSFSRGFGVAEPT
jgi:ribose 5-phosphate isomerase A